VRREIPQHVHVALDQPEVDSYRIDELQLAEHAGLDEFADPLNCGGVAVRVVAHQDDALVLRSAHECPSVGVARRERLLHENMLARLNRRHRHFKVTVRRRRHGDGLEVGVVQQLP